VPGPVRPAAAGARVQSTVPTSASPPPEEAQR